MNEFLHLILALTLAGSCVAGITALAAHICEKWAPRRFLYMLWLPALLSFWLPLGTRYSLFSSVEQMQVRYQRHSVGQQTQMPRTETPESVLNFVPVEEDQAVPRDIPAGQLLFSLWMLGAAGCALWQLAGYCWFRRQVLSGAQPPERWEEELLERLTAGRKPRLLRSDNVAGPLLMGLRHSALILPRRSYMPQVLEDILEHELCHWRRRDLIVKWLAALTACIHWFNPVCWYLMGRIARDCELACDEQVTARQNREQRLRYGRTLILVAAENRAYGHGLTASMYTQKQQLKERLEYLMEEKKNGRRVTAAVCAAVLVVALSTTVFGAYLGNEHTARFEAFQDNEETQLDMEQTGKEAFPGTAAEEVRQEPSAGAEEAFLVPVRMDKILLSMLYGDRVHPVTGETRSHSGIDIVADKGTEILASKSGVVTVSGYEGAYGNYVVISHGDGQSTLYAHMSERKAGEGDTVVQGQVIGLVGSTGASTGAHLHFEVREENAWIDPLSVLDLEMVYLRGNDGEEVIE